MRGILPMVVPAGLALAAAALAWPPELVFALTAIALLPAAKTLGDAVEDVAARSGPRLGGLLTATLGGAAELTIAVTALRAGLFDLVKASIVGAIVGNLLIVLGLSAFVGGLRHGTQYFDRKQAGLSGTMLILGVVALAVPALYGELVPYRNSGPVESLSEAVAAVILAVYLLSLYYSLSWNLEEQAIAGVHRETPAWSPRRGVALLVVALAVVGILSTVLVAHTPGTVARLGTSELFLGVTVIPLVGSVAQHLGAVEMAWRNRMDVATTIAMGSSLQIVLFVTPLLVFMSLVIGRPMDLIFNRIELVALGGSAVVGALVALDGESHWLEGVMLLAVALLLGLACFWWPAAGAVALPPVP